MGMIRLKNVSKYYYNKGIIASGISRIILNVISGLDTYEEGEMYIEGKETSHYSAADFEEYRQKYISCIFQNFNLVSSYTVYQNVALAMQIDGRSNEEIKEKVPEIIEKVGLTEFTRRKVSRLSGGQKQRVAIARALAKDTRILVADEPTGNLDSDSAQGIVELLTEIASDKLVIVVTHNYEQFKNHATRVIKMHDGRIAEDTGAANGSTLTPKDVTLYASYDDDRIREIRREVGEATGHRAGSRAAREERDGKKREISYGTQLRLGVRNTFNLPAKFLLLLLVFIFVVGAVSSQYVTVRKQRDTVSEEGWNNYFANYDPKRVVIEKSDRSPFTKADYEALENAPHVEKLVREDMMFDSQVYIENEFFSFYGYMQSASNLDKEVTLGGMPTGDNDVVLEGYDDEWTFGEDPKSLIGKSFEVVLDNGDTKDIRVAGIVLLEMDDDDAYGYGESSQIYFSDKMMGELRKSMYASNGSTTMLINGTEETLYPGEGGLVTNENVPEGYILLPTSYDGMFKKGYAAGNEIRLTAKTLYYEQRLDLMIMGTYGEKTFTKKTGLKELSEHDGEIYINPTDYRRLYEKGSFQASVFVDDTRNMEGMKDMLERGGYHVLVLRDHIYNFLNKDLLSVIQLPVAVILCIAVFFIAYFVIRLILKSRGVYFATVRMLGMGKKPARRIMRIELMIDCAIAFAIFMIFVFLSREGVIMIPQLADHIMYLTPVDFVILAVILLVMAVLISGRFMRTIFKSSAMGTYREEA